MLQIPDNILKNENVQEIFLVTPKKCLKLNLDSVYYCVHPSIDNELSEYVISINYKDGSCTTISLEK